MITILLTFKPDDTNVYENNGDYQCKKIHATNIKYHAQAKRSDSQSKG